MECLIVEQSDVSEDRRRLRITGEEAHHAFRSLRLREGDELLASNLRGTSYRATITRVEQANREVVLECEILEVLHNFGESLYDVHLIQGLISQPGRWEFLLEKATELGVSAIWPVETERSEVRGAKPARAERVMRAAVKQSRRSSLPELRELSTLSEAFSEALANKREIFVLHESAPRDHSLKAVLGSVNERRISLAVGPEGGFSDAEIALASERFGAQIVSLGSRRLRAETAAIAALAVTIAD